MGVWYRRMRENGMSIEEAASVPAPLYEDGSFMSSDPADHHSKTKQDINHQEGNES